MRRGFLHVTPLSHFIVSPLSLGLNLKLDCVSLPSLNLLLVTSVSPHSLQITGSKKIHIILKGAEWTYSHLKPS